MNDGFADRLRALRRQKELSQTDLARLVGVHYNHIGRYEREQSRPSAATLKKLADALGVSTDYLIDGDIQEAAKAHFDDRDLLRQFREIEALPVKDKEIIKELIDAFVVRRQLQKIATR